MGLIGFIIWIIVGAIIGLIAGAIVGKGDRMGFWLNLAAGIVGSWVGGWLLGDWGFHIAGIAIIPALIGAVIVVAVVSFIFKKRK